MRHSYRNQPHLSPGEIERCVLDLYLPEGTQDFATLIWLHGGGLTEGSIDDAACMGNWLAQQGIAVAMAEYRLAPAVAYPTYLDDAAASVAWVAEHIAEYGGNPAKLFVGGHSAGAYLAAMLAMKRSFLADYGVDAAQIAAYIPISGQMFTHFTVRGERGVENPAQTPTVDDAAPSYFVRPDAPPMLMICAENDLPTRTEENRYFVAVMKSVGHTDVQYAEIPDRDHGSIVDRMHEPDDPTGQLIVNYIRERVGSLAI